MILQDLIQLLSLFQNIIAVATFLSWATDGGQGQGTSRPQWFFYISNWDVIDINLEHSPQYWVPDGCTNHCTVALSASK